MKVTIEYTHPRADEDQETFTGVTKINWQNGVFVLHEPDEVNAFSTHSHNIKEITEE